MHFGHSHSHHHHHDHDHASHKNDLNFSWRQIIPSRRISSRVAFSALVTLLPPLFLRTHKLFSTRIAKTDVAAFIATSMALAFSQNMKKQVQVLITSAKRLRDGVVKHTSSMGDENVMKPHLYKRQLSESKQADKVTYLGVIVNLLLSIGKGVIGITCNSAALVADAGHSLSDLFSDFITLVAVRIGRLPPDDDHPYGHGKFESIGSLFLALTLLATGVSMGAVCNRRLIELLSVQFNPVSNAASMAQLIPEIPTYPCLIMAFLSISSKEWLYRITKEVGEKIHSQVVIANAWHHRSDAYSSVLALLSIGLAMTFPSLIAIDSAAGLLVSGMIGMTGFEILVESIKELTDTSNEALVQRIRTLIEKEEVKNLGEQKNISTGDVINIERVRSRQVGSLALVDVEVATADGLSSSATRAIEDRIKWRIMEEEGKGGRNEGEGGGTVFDAEVHAISSGTKNCPLLLSKAIHNHHDHDHSHAEDGSEKILSASMVEEDTRSLLKSHPKVYSVEGVTVHYHDTLLIDVDAQIRVEDPESTTVQNAHLLAEELRKKLEQNDNIHKAKIFLDLNTKTSELNPFAVMSP